MATIKTLELQVKVDSANQEVKIPVCPGSYFSRNTFRTTIDWGDSVTNNQNDDSYDGAQVLTHTYSQPATYTISITGGWVENSTDASGYMALPRHTESNSERTAGDYGLITSIKTTEHFHIHGQGDFREMTILESLDFSTPPARLLSSNPSASSFVGITTSGSGEMLMDSTFMDCYNLNAWVDIGDVGLRTYSGLNTLGNTTVNMVHDGVTSCKNMFKNVKKTSTTGKLKDWYVSDVTDFSGMFEGSGFQGNLQGWELKSEGGEVSMNSMFKDTEYNHFGFLDAAAGWDTQAVTDMGSMFENNTAISRGLLSNLDTSQCVNMSKMFKGATGLKNISKTDVFKGWDVSSVTDFSSMFEASGISSSHELAFTSGLATSGNINMSRMFADTLYNQSDYLAPPSSGGWNTINVTDMSGMYENNTAFTRGVISNFDVRNVTNMSRMFAGCTGLKNTDKNCFDGWDVSKVTDFSGMFEGSTVNHNLGWSLNKDLTASINMNSMFKDASLYNDPDKRLKDWTFDRVTDTGSMFENAVNFSRGNIMNWDTSNVTNMSRMFAGTEKFTPVDGTIGIWDVSKVTDFTSMFDGSLFNSELGGWTINTSLTAEVNMSRMFANCPYNKTGFSSWDVSRVTNMSGMFQDNTAFQSGAIKAWNTGSVKDMSHMFHGATRFNTSKPSIHDWNVRKVADFTSMFEGSAYNQSLYKWYNRLDAKNIKMDRMFAKSAFNHPSIKFWFTDDVVSMESMFEDNIAFNQELAKDTGGGFNNTSKVVTMKNMFKGATAFTDIKNRVNQFNVGNVSDFTGMFEGSGFNGLIDNWVLSTDKIIVMDRMFKDTNYSKDASFTSNSLTFENVKSMESFMEGNKTFNGSLASHSNELANLENISRMMADTGYTQDMSTWDLTTGSLTGYEQFNDEGVLPDPFYPLLPSQLRLKEGYDRILKLQPGTSNTQQFLENLLQDGLVLFIEGVEQSDLTHHTVAFEQDMASIASNQTIGNRHEIVMSITLNSGQSNQVVVTQSRVLEFVDAAPSPKAVENSVEKRTIKQSVNGLLAQTKSKTLRIFTGTDLFGYVDPAKGDTGGNTLINSVYTLKYANGNVINVNPRNVYDVSGVDVYTPGTYLVPFEYLESGTDPVFIKDVLTVEVIDPKSLSNDDPEKPDLTKVKPEVVLNRDNFKYPQGITISNSLIKRNLRMARDIEDGDITDKMVIKYNYSGSTHLTPPDGNVAGTTTVIASYQPENKTRPPVEVSWTISIDPDASDAYFWSGDEIVEIPNSGVDPYTDWATATAADLYWTKNNGRGSTQIVWDPSSGFNNIDFTVGSSSWTLDDSNIQNVQLSDAGDYEVTYNFVVSGANFQAPTDFTRTIRVLPDLQTAEPLPLQNALTQTESTIAVNSNQPIGSQHASISINPLIDGRPQGSVYQLSTMYEQPILTLSDGTTQEVMLTGSIGTSGVTATQQIFRDDNNDGLTQSSTEAFALLKSVRTNVYDPTVPGSYRYTFAYHLEVDDGYPNMTELDGATLTTKMLFINTQNNQKHVQAINWELSYLDAGNASNYQFQTQSASAIDLTDTSKINDNDGVMGLAVGSQFFAMPYTTWNSPFSNVNAIGGSGNRLLLPNDGSVQNASGDNITYDLGGAIIDPTDVYGATNGWFGDVSNGQLKMSTLNTLYGQDWDTALLVGFDINGSGTQDGVSNITLLRSPVGDITAGATDGGATFKKGALPDLNGSNSLNLFTVHQDSGGNNDYYLNVSTNHNYTTIPAYTGDDILPATKKLFWNNAMTLPMEGNGTGNMMDQYRWMILFGRSFAHSSLLA